MLPVDTDLKNGDKEFQQMLALATRLDALLRRQDRLEHVIERGQAQAPP